MSRRLTRHAILIGCGGIPGGQSYLPGVSVDLRAYLGFLLSDEGGAWNEDEVALLQNTTWQSAASHLIDCEKYDYTLVSFHGHGAYDPYRSKTQILFADGETVDLEMLRTGSRRQLILTDSCRTLPEDFGEPQYRVGAEFGGEIDESRRATCRWLYDSAIAQAEPGTSFVLACGIGEAADESPDGGGEFSRTLLGVCDAWSNASPMNRLGPRVLPIREAFDFVEQHLLRRRATQRPVYYGGRRRRHFPMAVR